MPFTVGICTLGCRVNQYESDVIAADFKASGCTVLDFDSTCDIYVINTCTVTSESDRKSRQMIRRALKHNKNATVIVCGCFAQVSPDCAAIEGVSLVIGNVGKNNIARRAIELASNEKIPAVIEVGEMTSADFERCVLSKASKTRAFVKIEDGCDCRCAYCIIPAARGHIRSKPKEDVIDEIRNIALSGCREVVLTGIETASYGLDFSDSYGLAQLLVDVSKTDGIERIRMGSLTPAVMTREFTDTVASLPKVMPNFHLSMQSGSNKILRLMHRRYNTSIAFENIAYVRSQIPNATFGTDMMTGFPGETEADFDDTINFCKAVEFANIHIFAYSKRAGTEAAAMDNQVDEHIKNIRSARLQKVADEQKYSLYARFASDNETTNVLFETFDDGIARGHNPEFFEVAVKSGQSLEGVIAKVKLSGCEGDLLRGDIV